MLHTTFALAKQAGACKPSYQRYAEYVGGVRRYGRHTPIPLTNILKVLGLEDTLWCLRCVLPEQSSERDRLTRLFACDCAEHVAHLWIALPGITWTPADTISVVRRYTLGQATGQELRAAARDAGDASLAFAKAAIWAAPRGPALAAVRAAVWTTRGPAWAARAAVWTTRGSAWAAARAAARTTSDASLASAWAAACLWQTECLRRHLTEEAI